MKRDDLDAAMDVRELEPFEDITPPVPTEQNQGQADGWSGSAGDGGSENGGSEDVGEAGRLSMVGANKLFFNETLKVWALDGENFHAIDSVNYSNTFYADGLCYAISGRSHC